MERQVKDAILGEDVTKILTNKIRNLNAMPARYIDTRIAGALNAADRADSKFVRELSTSVPYDLATWNLPRV